jgi:hypothetical protein
MSWALWDDRGKLTNKRTSDLTEQQARDLLTMTNEDIYAMDDKGNVIESYDGPVITPSL